MLTAPSGPTATPNSTTIQGWGATLDRAGPGQPELFLGDDLVAIRAEARVGQLDDDAGALGLRGGERVRLAARDAQLVAVQEAAVVVVQPVAVAVGAGHLPVRRAQEEGLAILGHDRIADASGNRGDWLRQDPRPALPVLRACSDALVRISSGRFLDGSLRDDKCCGDAWSGKPRTSARALRLS